MNDVERYFSQCAVCGSGENGGQRLCMSCQKMGETFTALSSSQPGPHIVAFINRTKGALSRLVSVFFYLRESQVESIEQVIEVCRSHSLKADKSKVIRLAIHLGLAQIFALSPSDLLKAIHALEEK